MANNSPIHIHEIEPELSSGDIDGTEVLVVSNPNGLVYNTNKLTLESLKEYVNRGDETVAAPSSGYMVFDTTPNHSDYVWKQQVGGTTGHFQKELTQDCLVSIHNSSGTVVDTRKTNGITPNWRRYEEFRIDGQIINFHTMRGTTLCSHIFVRAGRTIQFNTFSSAYVSNISVFPILSGGGPFIDVNKMTQVGETDINGDWIYSACTGNKETEIQLDYDALVNVTAENDSQNNELHPLSIDGMKILLPSYASVGTGYFKMLVLKQGQVLRPISGIGNYTVMYSIYPIET